MKELSYTQKYLLCATNGKGNYPMDPISFPAWLMGGGLFELLDQGYIMFEGFGIIATNEAWNDELAYLQPLYEKIKFFYKPITSRDFASSLMGWSPKDALVKILLKTVGESLVKAGYADRLDNQGLLKRNTKYVPKPDASGRIVKNIRDEILHSPGDASISDEALYMAALIGDGNFMHKYFEKKEMKVIKDRILNAPKKETYNYIKNMIDEVVLIAHDQINAQNTNSMNAINAAMYHTHSHGPHGH